MNKLNNKGLSVIEVVLTFALVMIIASGILTIIMNYRYKMQIEMVRMELVSYKNTLTKEIQTDILDRGIHEINTSGLCLDETDEYSGCVNIVFKDGVEKILAVSKLESENESDLRQLLNNKYIKYGDTKYPIEDKLIDKIPEGRSIKDFQNVYINSDNFLSSDTVILANGEEAIIYSIDINMEHIDYDDDFGIHIVATNNDTLSTSMISEVFTHTGDVIEYIVPANGTYKLELWGASGGNKDSYTGGLGSYVSGYTQLEKGTTLYLYIGGAGAEKTITGGYNGGSSITEGQENYGSPGGGATDIRTTGGKWNNFESLKSRIIVAAGGGGANNRNFNSTTVVYGAGNGGSGGGLIGYSGEAINYKSTTGYTSYNEYRIGTGGTQSSGGNILVYDSTDKLSSTLSNGSFGKILNDSTGQSGAGGGWFTGANSAHAGAGGGSSYISGHDGCLAIDQTSTEHDIRMKTTSEYEGYYFDNTTMIDGEGYKWTTVKGEQTQMPSPNNQILKAGNVGDGYIKITYLGI